MEKTLARPNISLIEALETLRKAGSKCLIIVDKDNKLLGTLTDGDLRSIIISGHKLNKSIKKYYNKNPKFVYQNNFNLKDLKNDFLREKYDLIPVITKKKKVIDIITWDQAFKKDLTQNKLINKKIKLVVMAGGLGQRLKPFTSILPKPLIPINNKSVLEHILDNFYNSGIKDVYISLNYKSKTMKSYCQEIKSKFNIKFLVEKKPLGTIGSLKLLKNNNDKPIFVTNSDIIIKSNISDMYNFHQNKNNDLTMVVAAKQFIIPYGVCKTTSDGTLNKIDEKPRQEALINTGLYLINPKIVNLIPKNKEFDITHLISAMKKKKKKIGVFPIADDAWVDVGQWSEYREAAEKLKK